MVIVNGGGSEFVECYLGSRNARNCTIVVVEDKIGAFESVTDGNGGPWPVIEMGIRGKGGAEADSKRTECKINRAVSRLHRRHAQTYRWLINTQSPDSTAPPFGYWHWPTPCICNCSRCRRIMLIVFASTSSKSRCHCWLRLKIVLRETHFCIFYFFLILIRRLNFSMKIYSWLSHIN